LWSNSGQADSQNQRANHDCRPNANYYFDTQTLTQHVHALTTIAAGEEITITYIDPVQVHADRSASLKRNWGFDCTCSQCRLTSLLRNASDDRVVAIGDLDAQLDDYGDSREADPDMAEYLVSLCDQERLWAPKADAYIKAAFEYSGVGNEYAALKYARLGLEFGFLYSGPWDEDVEEMRMLLSGVKKHASWKMFYPQELDDKNAGSAAKAGNDDGHVR
jgi:hypothetical protein